MKRIDSEYKALKSVLLYVPNTNLTYKEPSEVLHTDKIDFTMAKKEFQRIIHAYENEGIELHLINDEWVDNADEECKYNMMYVRDLFFMTPEGAVIANMHHKIRSKEVKYVKRELINQSIPIVGAIEDDGTFEGADAIWTSDSSVLIGIGKRTNFSGYRQLEKILDAHGIECHPVPLDPGIPPQHLLGVLQIVDYKKAFLRTRYADSKIHKYLSQREYQIIDVPDNDEVRNRQAFNIVTISPGRIFMPIDCPETKSIYEKNDVKVAKELEIHNIIKGGGGIACATGILERLTQGIKH